MTCENCQATNKPRDQQTKVLIRPQLKSGNRPDRGPTQRHHEDGLWNRRNRKHQDSDRKNRGWAGQPECGNRRITMPHQDAN